MTVLYGSDLKRAFMVATGYLERYRDAINALNVFPVPDGDTGTNMLLTMRSAMERCEAATGTDGAGVAPMVAEVAGALADGSFWGARGNSGVILSQFFKGLAAGLWSKEGCTGADLAQAFSLATEAAYKAVGQPVEGTMLTVIRSVSEAAQERVDQGDEDPLSVWEAAFLASLDALRRTPSQLPVLRQAGVMDAGGMGIVAIMGGVWSSLSGREDLGLDEFVGEGEERLVEVERRGRPNGDFLESTQEVQWGYCTQFLIAGQNLDLERLRERFSAMADSSVVVDLVFGSFRDGAFYLHWFDLFGKYWRWCMGLSVSYKLGLGYS